MTKEDLETLAEQFLDEKGDQIKDSYTLDWSAGSVMGAYEAGALKMLELIRERADQLEDGSSSVTLTLIRLLEPFQPLLNNH